ncbi:MAG TPA: hypothetical protein VHZ09_17985 [Acidobacteriaceae bacterium]|jgi:hypothetical protein|nr:hypothetical protein [Acidobacteriaceae bacterium]
MRGPFSFPCRLVDGWEPGGDKPVAVRNSSWVRLCFFLPEEFPQLFSQPDGVAGQYCVARESPGFEMRICQVTDKLTSVISFNSQRGGHGGFDRIIARHFEEHHVEFLPAERFIQLPILPRILNRESFLLQSAMHRASVAL